MPDITIGGERVTLPEVMNFASLKAAWPQIQVLGQTRDPIERMSAAIGVVAAALGGSRPELTAQAIEARIAAHELPGLVAALPDLFKASGLVPAEGALSGEAVPAASGSTI